MRLSKTFFCLFLVAVIVLATWNPGLLIGQFLSWKSIAVVFLYFFNSATMVYFISFCQLICLISLCWKLHSVFFQCHHQTEAWSRLIQVTGMFCWALIGTGFFWFASFFWFIWPINNLVKIDEVGHCSHLFFFNYLAGALWSWSSIFWATLS